MIHLSVDGNGRMCHLVLNAILQGIKYAGVVVAIGEHKAAQEYINIQKRASEEAINLPLFY